jgi:hypothetical protein
VVTRQCSPRLDTEEGGGLGSFPIFLMALCGMGAADGFLCTQEVPVSHRVGWAAQSCGRSKEPRQCKCVFTGFSVERWRLRQGSLFP